MNMNMSRGAGSAFGGKTGSTWFLRAVLALMAIIGLAVGIFALPAIYTGVPNEWPATTKYLHLFIVGLYLSAIPFFTALYQAFKLLNYIDKNTAFSASSVAALKYIKYSAIASSVLYATGIPFLFQVAELDDAPGLGVIALAFACTPLVIATFAAVLEKLLQNAINIKSENELTV
jgi:hypothetical protein